LGHTFKAEKWGSMSIKRYNLKYFKHKIYDSFIRKAILSSIDRRRIQKKYPNLQRTYEENRNDYKNNILPFYEQYVSKVSNEIMAISLELTVFCIMMFHISKPKRILDLGSGFSSFAFRFMPSILNQEYRPTVWSVDDSQEWLNKTRQFLSSHSITCDHLTTWESLIQGDSGLFDFVLFDIGGFQFRMEIFEQAISLVNTNGIMIIDDMHSAELGRFVLKFLKKIEVSCFDVGYYTRDKINRYSLLIAF
jgi:predicted O-methyltransferase YrrM